MLERPHGEEISVCERGYLCVDIVRLGEQKCRCIRTEG
jgi:hypothetical protein